MSLPRRALLLAPLLAATPARAQQPTTKLTPVPGAPTGLTAAGGTAALSADRATATLAFSLRYWNLSGPATAIRLEGPEPLSIAMAGHMPAASPLAGRIALTPTQMQNLLAGRYTLALATAAFPNGEITGPATIT